MSKLITDLVTGFSQGQNCMRIRARTFHWREDTIKLACGKMKRFLEGAVLKTNIKNCKAFEFGSQLHFGQNQIPVITTTGKTIVIVILIYILQIIKNSKFECP